jgi:hypothetical protein
MFNTQSLSGRQKAMVNNLLSLKSQQLERPLRTVWESLTPSSCPEFYNFHLHTCCSDGKMTPESLIQQAVRQGLRGLAITDHHSVAGYRRAQSWLSEQSDDDSLHPQLWSGIEITSDLEGTEVHILGYDFDPDHPGLAPYLTGDRPRDGHEVAANVINAIHGAGGLVVLAHPARYRRSATHLIPAAARYGIDGVEAFYAYGNPKPWTSSQPQMEEVCYLGDLSNLFRTCGTDSHGESIMYRL